MLGVVDEAEILFDLRMAVSCQYTTDGDWNSWRKNG